MNTAILTDPGFIGAMGALLGVMGGLYGAYCSYKSAKSVKERKSVICFSILILFLVAAFTASMVIVPGPAKAWLVIPYVLILFALIAGYNAYQRTLDV